MKMKHIYIILTLWILGVSNLYSQFITTWETTNPNESITIPTEGVGYNYSVDWGDGNSTDSHTDDAIHTYTTAGVYTVSVTGDFPRIFFNVSFFTTDNDAIENAKKIKSIEQWGDNQWSSFASSFSGCINLEGNAMDTPDLTNATNLSRMFFGATSFNQNIDNWDVQNVTSTGEMLRDATSFNKPLNSWKLDNLQSISGMFRGASSFNQSLSSWNFPKVKDMSQLFFGASAFNQSLEDWDVSNITTMSFAFYYAGLSVENYDKTIEAWSNLTLENNVTIGVSGISFCESETERQSIIDDFLWNFDGDSKDCGVVLSISSSNEVTKREAVVYPNPVANRLYISDVTEGGFEIYNSTGQMIIEDVFNNHIDISDLTAGVYFMKIKNNAFVYRFVKH